MECDHAPQVRLVVLRKTTGGCEFIGVAECPEDAIPPGDVAIIKSMNVELVVDGVMFGALKEVAHPVGGAQVAVVEVFADYGEDVEPGVPSEDAPRKQNSNALARMESATISTGCL